MHILLVINTFHGSCAAENDSDLYVTKTRMLAMNDRRCQLVVFRITSNKWAGTSRV